MPDLPASSIALLSTALAIVPIGQPFKAIARGCLPNSACRVLACVLIMNWHLGAQYPVLLMAIVALIFTVHVDVVSKKNR